ncbi:hypothetical protein ACTOB_003692 [Actinoplanes oblitus]|uniref:Uncharacterized protein n=1 Tax=Actinoplanes oblitus TaxID=3040509 RepID=A0ABY8WQ49_9ACTN|nr:hypothetical protein [Actinoplanes oblitus]WIN00017.1 hypothetical protein ACTOB_003692 [Actinoplanes oblitus]
MDPALMNDEQRRQHFQRLAKDYARRYAQFIIDALGGAVSSDAAAVLHRVAFEFGHDACQVIAREIQACTAPRTKSPDGATPIEASSISATTYTFTVLHPFAQRPADLFTALTETNNGHSVGAVTAEHTVAIPDAEVPGRLRELGNDGTSFNDELPTDTA